MTLLRASYALGALLGLAACSDTSSAGTGTASSNDASTTAAASASGIGVAECDTYLSRMRKCIEAAPEAERSARAKSVDDIESAWRSQAGPESKSRLTTPCKKALEQMDADGYCK